MTGKSSIVMMNITNLDLQGERRINVQLSLDMRSHFQKWSEDASPNEKIRQACLVPYTFPVTTPIRLGYLIDPSKRGG